MASSFLKLGTRITFAPLIYGSGDYAIAVRQMMLSESFDCLAVPLPASFQEDVEAGVLELPQISAVVQSDAAESEPQIYRTEWTPDSDDEDEEDLDDEWPAIGSFVPIDPCQGVIAAIRTAMGEHIPRRFIDLETIHYQPYALALPDPYALKKVSIEKFAAAVVPSLPRLPEGQPRDRMRHMAARLRELEGEFESILCVCSILDWPWIREAYQEQHAETAEPEETNPTTRYPVDPQTLLFCLGELPYITGLYERAREELEADDNLSLDGVKDLLLTTRDRYLREFGKQARPITPQLMTTFLRYVRNLSLIEHRMTPDLYTLVVAAKQIAGDPFALHLAEASAEYLYQPELEHGGTEPGAGASDVASDMEGEGEAEPVWEDDQTLMLGLDRGRLPGGDLIQLVNRLQRQPAEWRSIELHRRPQKWERRKWEMRWNPFKQCSYPPEDEAIESFRTHVQERARSLIGNDLAQSEKFTSSLKDGLDIRETLRNWYNGELYVKVVPPTRGGLEAVIMLFDSPADPREYPWRSTWYAEHENESTLAFFGSNYRDSMIGPGICQATYGGAMFLYPPRNIPDIWTDTRLDFAETLEERLLAAACFHSREPHIAILSGPPPGAAWRRLAKRFRKRLVHVPLSKFSAGTIAQLRVVHVLNGREVRSYAADFIRKA